MNKIDIYTRVIGKCGNLLMVTNDSGATLNTSLRKAFIVEADTGKHLIGEFPIDFLMRAEEDLEWKPVNEYYVDTYQKKRNPRFCVERDGLLGFAVGDALGVPVEFMKKEDVRAVNVTDMMGNDTNMNFKSRWSDLIPAGAWSDDTSMTYASMDAIMKSGRVDDYDGMMHSYLDWWQKGKYTALDFPFGLGRTVGDSLSRYLNGYPASNCGGVGERDNGNGSLMRIFPHSIYCIEKSLSEAETARIISDASAITHGHDISKMSCFIYTEFMRTLVETKNKELAFARICSIDYSKYFSKSAIDAHSEILKSDFAKLPDDRVNGSGYVVDSLKCALYSVMNSDNYEDTVKMAINTGYDTDTIGGIAGSLAGVLYGEEDIPKRWLDRLKKREELEFTALKYNIFIEKSKKNDLDSLFNDGYSNGGNSTNFSNTPVK